MTLMFAEPDGVITMLALSSQISFQVSEKIRAIISLLKNEYKFISSSAKISDIRGKIIILPF